MFQIIHPDDELLIETTPLPPHDLDDWKEWETWQPPAEIVKLAPFYKAGFDFDGLPGNDSIRRSTPGLLNSNEISELSNLTL